MLLKINVRAGILGKAIISLLFIEYNLMGSMYFNMLVKTIDPLKTVELETQINSECNLILLEELLHFQQD